MSREVYSKWWTLMQGLYYPAVLGTGLVLLISKFTFYKSFSNAASDISLYFGVLILIYFSASFLVNDKTPKTNYGPLPFLLDFIEIIFIFCMFYFLGFFDLSNPTKIDFRWFYISLAAVPVLQEFWNCAAKRRHFYILSIPATLILLIGFCRGFHYVGFNIVMILVIAALISTYFYKLVKG